MTLKWLFLGIVASLSFFAWLMIPVLEYGQNVIQERERSLLRNATQLEKACADRWPHKEYRYRQCLLGQDDFGGSKVKRKMLRGDI